MPTTDDTALAVCQQSVEHVVSTCSSTPSATEPPWDEIATSFSALSLTFAQWGLALAIIGALLALAWGVVVVLTARDSARKAAKEEIAAWLAVNAPRLIQDRVDQSIQSGQIDVTPPKPPKKS